MRAQYSSRGETEKLEFFAREPKHREGRLLSRFFSALMTLASLVAVVALPYLLAKDFARVRRSVDGRAPSSLEMQRFADSALASGGTLVRDAFTTTQYAAGWAKLAWISLSDFESSLELLKTPPDRHEPTAVMQKRRRGADQLVILLDRHGLLPLLMQGRNHQQLAQRIGDLLGISPDAVAETFREARADQLAALREAIDRHLSDEPAASDLAHFREKH